MQRNNGADQRQEAFVGVLKHGSFFGEGCLVSQRACMATDTALNASTIVRIEKAAMVRVLHHEPSFSVTREVVAEVVFLHLEITFSEC